MRGLGVELLVGGAGGANLPSQFFFFKLSLRKNYKIDHISKLRIAIKTIINAKKKMRNPIYPEIQSTLKSNLPYFYWNFQNLKLPFQSLTKVIITKLTKIIPIFKTLKEISHQRVSRSGRFIVLNDLAGPKMPTQIIFQFLSNILELFDSRRGKIFMTVDRNFVRFAHS